MGKNRLIDKIAALIAVSGIIMSCGMVAVFAQNDEQYKISGYDVTVNVKQDGSAEIIENIKFTFYDGFNNIMIPISKNEGEEIEVEHVYILCKAGLIDCKRLLAGQWDAEVFTGTYSVIDEANAVKVKLYGSFYKSYGSVILQYKVKNAVKRYKDVAEYDRIHILKTWETRISDVNISIYLPNGTDPGKIDSWLHGVFVGRKKLSEDRIVVYNVPDTVPGEYVETRVLFPPSLVKDCPVTEDKPYYDQAIEEEAEYQKSDKTDLLAARETAARNAGQKAFNERLKQRAKNIFSILSLLLCGVALYYFLIMQRKLHQRKNMATPATFHNIEMLDPAEVRMLTANGKTGARAMMGKLFELATREFIQVESRRGVDSKVRFIFRILQNWDSETLNAADRYLLGWISGLSHSNLEFDPIQLLGHIDSDEKAHGMKAIYDQWTIRVKEVYNGKNILDIGIVKYRNAGIISGVLLLFLGFVIPVTLSIAVGFSMIPVGLFMLIFSLRIRKHTDYGICQHKIWKTIRQRIKHNNIALDAFPEWMRPYTSLIAYAAAMGVEKEVVRMITDLLKSHPADCDCLMCSIIKRQDATQDSALYRMVKNTLNIFDEAVSSVQDAV